MPRLRLAPLLALALALAAHAATAAPTGGCPFRRLLGETTTPPAPGDGVLPAPTEEGPAFKTVRGRGGRGGGGPMAHPI